MDDRSRVWRNFTTLLCAITSASTRNLWKNLKYPECMKWFRRSAVRFEINWICGSSEIHKESFGICRFVFSKENINNSLENIWNSFLFEMFFYRTEIICKSPRFYSSSTQHQHQQIVLSKAVSVERAKLDLKLCLDASKLSPTLCCVESSNFKVFLSAPSQQGKRATRKHIFSGRKIWEGKWDYLSFLVIALLVLLDSFIPPIREARKIELENK